MNGEELLSKAVILSAGTFMNAIMHTGLTGISGGRYGEKAIHWYNRGFN